MVTWSEFEIAQPEMGAAGRKLLYQFGLGLAFLATIRKDGGPRLHPICPTIVNGRLYALIGPSPKRGDLIRDGRYALHTFPPQDVDDEFFLAGRAIFIEEAGIREAVRADAIARGMTSTHDEFAFEFQIERAMHAAYPGGHGTWPPKYSVWTAGNR